MCIEWSVNISITRITRVNHKCFCYVAIISTHANFQVVTMVAEFCSLVILIAGRERSVIQELQGLTKILYLYSLSRNDTFPHAKIIGFVVIEVRFFENMAKCEKHFYYTHFTSHHNTTILVIFHTFFTLISLKTSN